jgi:hypothetical protein
MTKNKTHPMRVVIPAKRKWKPGESKWIEVRPGKWIRKTDEPIIRKTT